MHELSLCEGILRIIQDQAVAQGFSCVKSVHLEIGPFPTVEARALRFGFEVASRGTLAQDSKLEITHLPANAWCGSCAKQVEVAQRFDPCPICGKYQVEISGGEEMRIKDLEVI